MTASARAGKLDPVIGRDDEIRRMMHILCRRTKNNPVRRAGEGGGAGIAFIISQGNGRLGVSGWGRRWGGGSWGGGAGGRQVEADTWVGVSGCAGRLGTAGEWAEGGGRGSRPLALQHHHTQTRMGVWVI